MLNIITYDLKYDYLAFDQLIHTYINYKPCMVRLKNALHASHDATP